VSLFVFNLISIVSGFILFLILIRSVELPVLINPEVGRLIQTIPEGV